MIGVRSRFAAPLPTRLPAPARTESRLLFIAKHVHAAEGLHPEDGNHALYHREIRTILEELDIQLQLADNYEILFEDPGCDFVFPLLNRGGFLNSEMMLPLMCTRLGLPFLGASPILRGIADDKHATKLEAVRRGVPTAPWAIFRQGAPLREGSCPMAERMVVKPNASSASWGVSMVHDWRGVCEAVAAIHESGHDALVEPFLDGHDVEVPLLLSGGELAMCPVLMFQQSDPSQLRTYQEKRDLGPRGARYENVAFDDPDWQPVIAYHARQIAEAFHPFDYGRFEFRINPATGELIFLETNLNCNLWSEKTFGWAAGQMGWSHRQLIETILTESMMRQGLIGAHHSLAA